MYSGASGKDTNWNTASVNYDTALGMSSVH